MTDRADNFNRTDSTTSINSPSDGGANYAPTSGTWGIASNTGYCVSSTAQAACPLETSVASGAAQVTLATMGSDCGLIGRLADDNNYILMAIAPTTVKLFKRVSGSFTQIGTNASLGIGSGAVAKLEITAADVITAYIGGVNVKSGTDSAGAANTKWGLRANSDTSTRFDTFSFTGTAARPVKMAGEWGGYAGESGGFAG